MKRYVLLAGVNGAGKSTLYSLITSLSDIYKINLDDTVRKNGDWRDPKAVVRATRSILITIDVYLKEGVSFVRKQHFAEIAY